MPLKKSQVKLIENDLIRRGIKYPELREDLLDHLCTEIEYRMEKGERFRNAYQQALNLFVPDEIEKINERTMRNLSSVSLLKSYFRTAVRNMHRHKFSTGVNVFGLSSSFTICLLILVFLQHELSYDTTADTDIYRLVSQSHQPDGSITSTAFTGAPWGPAMVDYFPEFSEAARIMKYRLDVLVTVKAKDESFFEPDLIWADQELIDFFNLKILQGNPKELLTEPNSVIISKKTARKYFGNESAIGQVLVYNNEVNLEVTGVMEDFPDNLHFRADIIASFNTLNSFWSIIDNWTIRYYHTYFRVHPQANIASVEEQFEDFFLQKIGNDWVERRSAYLQDAREIHLTPGVSNQLKAGTDPQYLILLAVVSFVILLLATANFINLNIARSLKRIKEVGIRKTMGGLNQDLVVQFVMESLVLSTLSLLLAFIFTYLSLPFLNQLLERQLNILEVDGILLVAPLLMIILVSCLAGIYPAIKTSRFGIIGALRGNTSGKPGKSTLASGLILLQFTICSTLLVAIGVIKLQQSYLLNKDLGYSTDQLLMLSTNNLETQELPLVKAQLLSLPEIRNVSITSHKLAGDQPYHGQYAFSSPNKATDTLGLARLHVDSDFIETYKLKLVAGRDFDDRISSDTSCFLINEKAAKLYGISSEEALNTTISYLTQGENGRYLRTGKVLGVVADFHMESLHEEINGIVMDIQPPRAHFIACDLISSDYPQTLSKIKELMSPFLSGIPLDHFFLNDQFGSLYQQERKLDWLMTLASFIAIVIAMLGLLGLVVQLLSYKKKEIGLRKVMGAGTFGITQFISSKYIKLIGISLLIAFPLSYIWMNSWLESYPYRIQFPLVWMFSVGIAVAILTFLSILLITVKHTNTNPISALRDE